MPLIQRNFMEGLVTDHLLLLFEAPEVVTLLYLHINLSLLEQGGREVRH